MRVKAFFCSGHSLTERACSMALDVPQSASYMLGAQFRLSTFTAIETPAAFMWLHDAQGFVLSAADIATAIL